MAGLLVSVRSAREARAALDGGAAVIDVKEPARGPLGRASLATWDAIRSEVAGRVPLSVALGELRDFDPQSLPVGALDGIDYRKAGPTGLSADWPHLWNRIVPADVHPAGWVAVIYADSEAAGAPDPDRILDVALASDRCQGVLIDSWDKTTSCPIQDLDYWEVRINRAKIAGRLVALAGRLDSSEIRRLLPLQPDLFAVRGAACRGQDRGGDVQASLVSDLVTLLKTGENH